MKHWHTVSGVLLAWVLWLHAWSDNDYAKNIWHKSLTFISEAECREFAIETAIGFGKQLEADDEGTVDLRDGSFLIANEDGTLIKAVSICLPDNVDPQGRGQAG
jgi:hypothetical protein